MFRLRLWFLGLLLLIPYLCAWWLGDLRVRTVEFVILFFVVFALYTVATIDVVQRRAFSTGEMLGIFAFAIIMNGILLFTSPTLSDDMYRYIWDGRVQAHGVSPYRYPPAAEELLELRDVEIWSHINRKQAITVYPPAAQMSFALLWRLVPDRVVWFQAVMAACALVGGGLLIGLLRDLRRSTARVLIYLWSPLLIFETAHGAHVDGLVLPVMIGAWWARVRNQDALVGMLLAVATGMKLYPVLLFPALWRPQDRRARWQMPLAFVVTLVLLYLPYILRDGAGVLGFLPTYFRERFNVGLAGWLMPIFERLGLDPTFSMLLLTLSILASLALWMLFNPVLEGEAALRRCLWIIGAFTLLTQNLFSWYLLWLLPLIAIFLQPAKLGDRLAGLRLDAWSGWWLFCGLIALSYLFFIEWRVVKWAIWVQFIPLYLFLLFDLVRRYVDFSWRVFQSPARAAAE